MTQFLTLLGAAHIDQVIRLETAHLNRTNSGRSETSPGGVAANIARHIATEAADQPLKMQFIGAVTKDQEKQVSGHFSSLGIKPRLAVIDGTPPPPPPQYTAIIDADGELVIGAACMDLYDAVGIDHLKSYLPKTGSLVMDANFPADVLAVIAASLPIPLSLFATGTSIEKVSRLAPILPRLDGVVLNRGEAGRLTKAAPVEIMARSLTEKMRPGALALVSDGGAAAALSKNGQTLTMTPEPIDAQQSQANVNVAGDVMAAALFRRYITAPQDWNSEDRLKILLQEALDAGRTYAQRSAPS